MFHVGVISCYVHLRDSVLSGFSTHLYDVTRVFCGDALSEVTRLFFMKLNNNFL